MEYRDTVIIGAGPAGSSVAETLANSGRDVLIVDKASFPRHKVCGGGIPKRTKEILNCDYSHLVESKITSVLLVGGWGNDLRVDVDDMAEIVDRVHFDELILKSAVDAGASFLPKKEVVAIELKNNKWQIMFRGDDKSKLMASNICLASGAKVDIKITPAIPKLPLGIAIEGFTKIKKDANLENRQTAVFDFTCINGGYGWVFPRKNCYSVGIGTCKWKCPDIQKRLTKICSEDKYFGGNIRNISGAPLPFFTKPLPSYVFNNLYLLGDSAGLVDPLTGEGIFFAIKSGIFAAESIIKNSSNDYNEKLNLDIIPELCMAGRYARKARIVPKWLMRLLMKSNRYEKYARKFVSILSGNTTYRQMYHNMH